MITIGGTLIKTPASMGYRIPDLDKASRNTSGDTIIEFVAQKRKLELTWSFLTSAEAEIIRAAIKTPGTRIVSVQYPEIDGTLTTKNFYSGDLVMDVMDYKSGVIRWKNAKVSLVEV